MGSVCEDSFQALKLIEQSFLDNFKTISKTPSAKDPLSLVRQLLGIALNAAKTMADGIMDVVTIFLQWLKKYLNSEIQIPIFTKLFHTIGLPLPSVLDIICLIMAIPSTYACKAMRGKVLPNIKGLMERNPNGGTIKQYIEGTLRQQDQRDINLVAGMGSLVLGVLGAGIGAVILALDADPESVVVTQRKTLASSSFSTRHHMLGDPVLFNSPAARIFHGPKVATANTVCQFVNCFMGLTNVFLAFPIKLQSVVWLKWTVCKHSLPHIRRHFTDDDVHLELGLYGREMDRWANRSRSRYEDQALGRGSEYHCWRRSIPCYLSIRVTDGPLCHGGRNLVSARAADQNVYL